MVHDFRAAGRATNIVAKVFTIAAAPERFVDSRHACKLSTGMQAVDRHARTRQACSYSIISQMQKCQDTHM